MHRTTTNILVLLLALCACFARPVGAELPALIPRALLVGDPLRTAALISPDGKRLAYMAKDRRGLLSLWVQTIEKDDDRPATNELDRPLRLPSPTMPRAYGWQSDSKHLLFLLDQDGDEVEHLYQINLSDGNLRDLTPYKGVRAQVIPGGYKHPDTVLIALNLRDRKMMDAYRLELDTGKLTEVARNPGDVAEWFGNNHGEVVAAQVPHTKEGTIELRVRDAEGDPWRSLLTVGAEETVGTTFSPAMVCGFSMDDRKIRLAHSEGAAASRLVEVDLGSGKTTVVDEDPSADVGGMLVSSQTGDVDAVWRWKERRVWSVRNPELRADFERLAALDPGEMNIENRDAADRRWIVSFGHDTSPTVFYLYDREAREAHRLFCAQPDLERYQMARVKPISLPSRDGLTLHGYLTLPSGVEPKGLPLVLMVHGGPHLRDLWSANGWAQLLANRGYAVLQVNFRGSNGYGKAFLHAGDHAWGRQMLDDLVDAKGWAVKEGIADPKRCAVSGFSYGGYAALSALTFAPKEFACGVAAAAPCDLVSLLRNLPLEWLTVRAMTAHRLGDPEKDRTVLRERSPVDHAASVSAPLLLAHGLRDARVPAADAARFVEAMKREGKDVQYLTFPREGHTWVDSDTRMRWAEAIEKFLARHLGGRVEEAGLSDLLPHPGGIDGKDPVRLR